MSLCCTEIAELGCFTNCEIITTGLQAVQAGTHTIREYWLNGINDQDIVLSIGQNIDFPNIYNENADHVIKIIQPDGTAFTSGSFDCFRFKTLTTAE